MTDRLLSCEISRRTALLALLAGVSASPALAQRPLDLPLRIAYARVTPKGLLHPPRAEQEAFRALKLRTGALIVDAAPLPLGRLFDLSAPETDGGAACILLARQLAAAAGHERLLLYATDAGRRSYPHWNNWLSQAFASLRSEYGPYDPATGEAHLFDVAGGAPLLSIVSDARPRMAVNPFDRRDPEREAFEGLLHDFELRLQSAATDWLASERSIAD
jgi:hypothetical protein